MRVLGSDLETNLSLLSQCVTLLQNSADYSRLFCSCICIIWWPNFLFWQLLCTILHLHNWTSKWFIVYRQIPLSSTLNDVVYSLRFLGIPNWLCILNLFGKTSEKQISRMVSWMSASISDFLMTVFVSKLLWYACRTLWFQTIILMIFVTCTVWFRSCLLFSVASR